MNEWEYFPSQIAYYHESDNVNKVEILENNSDSKWIRYKLKVLSLSQESSITKPSEIGNIFSCEKRRNSNENGELWHLLDGHWDVKEK